MSCDGIHWSRYANSSMLHGQQSPDGSRTADFRQENTWVACGPFLRKVSTGTSTSGGVAVGFSLTLMLWTRGRAAVLRNTTLLRGNPRRRRPAPRPAMGGEFFLPIPALYITVSGIGFFYSAERRLTVAIATFPPQQPAWLSPRPFPTILDFIRIRSTSSLSFHYRHVMGKGRRTSARRDCWAE